MCINIREKKYNSIFINLKKKIQIMKDFTIFIKIHYHIYTEISSPIYEKMKLKILVKNNLKVPITEFIKRT